MTFSVYQFESFTIVNGGDYIIAVLDDGEDYEIEEGDPIEIQHGVHLLFDGDVAYSCKNDVGVLTIHAVATSRSSSGDPLCAEVARAIKGIKALKSTMTKYGWEMTLKELSLTEKGE